MNWARDEIGLIEPNNGGDSEHWAIITASTGEWSDVGNGEQTTLCLKKSAPCGDGWELHNIDGLDYCFIDIGAFYTE